jgi:3'(2'), 5'-bisphosphate nucleotidase
MTQLISSIKEIITSAGQIALDKKASGIIVCYKEDKSPVTNADKEISDFIYERLHALTPDIPVICEERTFSQTPNYARQLLEGLGEQNRSVRKGDEDSRMKSTQQFSAGVGSFWLIDPIDATKSYIRGDSTYTVNIALIKNGAPYLGFIYLPEAKKLYYTDENGNLQIEADSLPCKAEHHEEAGYIAVVSSDHPNKATKNFLTNNAITKVKSIPSSIKLCLIAEGSADIYPKFGQTMEWDIAAGHALVKATGGDIMDCAGKSFTYGKKNFKNPDFFACGNKWLRKNNNFKKHIGNYE